MKKTLVAFLILAALAVGAYFAYTQDLFAGVGKNSDSMEAETPVLRVLYGEWPPDLIAYLAEEKGFFDARGVNVELIQISGFDELFEIVEEGGADVWPITLLDSVVSYSEEQPWQIFLLEDFSSGADAVLVGPDSGILSVADLKGKTVGLESGTVSEFYLQILLSREDMNLDDLTVVDMPFDQIPSAFADASIDAAVTYEPAVSESLALGASVLTDTGTERGLIVDVYVGKKEDLSVNPDAYVAFMQGLLDASDYFNENREEAIEIMSEPFGSDTLELMDSFSKLRITDFRDNQTAFDRTSGFASIFIRAKQAEQYLEAEGLITAPESLDELFSHLIDQIER